MLGFSLWWYLAPEPLLLSPSVLSSPDLALAFRVSKDTFVHHVCSAHPEITSPCACGEPLNMEARLMFDGTSFDPLEIHSSYNKARVLAVYFSAI
jgi:hypothetical protein